MMPRRIKSSIAYYSWRKKGVGWGGDMLGVINLLFNLSGSVLSPYAKQRLNLHTNVTKNSTSTAFYSSMYEGEK